MVQRRDYTLLQRLQLLDPAMKIANEPVAGARPVKLRFSTTAR